MAPSADHPEWDPQSPLRPEEDLENLVAAYVDRLTEGETIDRDQILAEHPSLGVEILEHLESYVSLPSRGDEKPSLGNLGDYTLRRRIGRGGMGVVYEAWENSMDRRVALKVLPAGIAADDRASARFLREAQAAGKLSHPNVVPVYFTGVKEQTPFYAMEYVEGETLAQILARLKAAAAETETPFGRKDCAGYFEQLARDFADVADGLQHAHSKGVVHRDIKPSNLILEKDGRLCILDFGLARLEGQDSLTMSGDMLGTVLYMSPEQAMAKRIPVDHRTDIYSLGTTMYETLTWRPPFMGKTHQDTLSQIIFSDPQPPRQLSPRCPKDLETIVLKCLRKDPGDRYGTAEALAQDLRRFVRGDPIEARPQPKWEWWWRSARRHLSKLIAAGALLSLLAASLWLVREIQDERDRERRANLTAKAEAAIVKMLRRSLAGEFRRRGLTWYSRVLFPFSEQTILNPLTPYSEETSLNPVTKLRLRALRKPRVSASVEEAVRELEEDAVALSEETWADSTLIRDVRYRLAQAYHALGRDRDAAGALERALEHHPDFVPAEVLRLISNGESFSEDKLRQLRSTYDDPADWRKLWLDAYRGMTWNDWSEAATAYQALIELEDEPYRGCSMEAHLGLGQALLGNNDLESAIEHLSQSRSVVPGVEPLLLLAKAWYLLGVQERADGLKRRAESIVEIDVFRALGDQATVAERNEAVRWICELYLSLGAYEEARVWARRLRGDALRESLLAYLLLRERRFDEALGAARKAVAARPHSLHSHALLVSALLETIYLGRDEGMSLELAEACREALELGPGSREVHSLTRMAWAKIHRAEYSWRDDVMKARQILQAAAMAAGLSLSSTGFADEWLDDFQDKQAFDGDPVAWSVLPGCLSSDAEPRDDYYDARTGDLIMRPPLVGTQGSLAIASEAVLTGDVSIRARGRLVGQGRLWIFVHFVECGTVYIAAIENRTELDPDVTTTTVSIQPWNGWSFFKGLAEVQFLDDRDYVLQLDVRGVNLELRAWSDGEEMPDEPVVTVENTELRQGRFGIGYTSDELGAYGIYREVWVSGEAVGNPTYFRRGDCNADGKADVSDAICILGWLFSGAGEPGCKAVTNTNGDGNADLSDAVYLLSYLFLGGPAPVEPFPDCGTGTAEDYEELGCETPPVNCQSQ